MLLTLKINPEYEGLVPTMAKESYETLVSSIRTNGQYEPLTVNENGIVLVFLQFDDDLLAEKLVENLFCKSILNGMSR